MSSRVIKIVMLCLHLVYSLRKASFRSTQFRPCDSVQRTSLLTKTFSLYSTPSSIISSSVIEQSRSLNTYSKETLPSETLYIIDGTAMLYQAYFSRESKEEENQNAVFTETFSAKLAEKISFKLKSAAGLEPKLEGTVVDEVEDEVDIYEASSPKQLSCSALSVMAMNFARFIREVKPTYLAAAFDSSRKSLVRATVLPSYKSQRPATPTDLIPQLLAAPSLLEAFGCKCFRLDGHEADDLMASISRWGRGKGLNVVHVSIDKDMLQLVNTGVHVMRPGNFEVMGKEAVFEKFGVLPESLVDLLALMGDGADNIPGARGIGPKTAALLVNKFKSIEKMYEALGLDTLTLPAVDTEMKNAEEKKKVELLLKQAMPSDKLNHALEQVKSLGAKMQPIAILTSLYHLGYERAVLYRDLIRLKDDIDFESALLTSRPPVVPSSTADTAVNSNNNVLSTSFFRFRGESREWEVEDPQQRLEAIVGSMSTSLRKPLSMLRQQYHKIDRS